MSLPATPFRGGGRLLAGGLAAGLVGVGLLAVGLAVDRRQAFFSYLTAFAYVTSVAVAALIFLMIGHVSRARWFIVMRRLNEGVVAALPVLALAFVPIAFGLADLYPWVHPDPAAGEHAMHLLDHKRPYLNVPFFLGRAALYLAVWVAFSLALTRLSLRQDEGGGDAADLAGRARTLSAAGLPALALTLTFAAFDWLMSLTPAWFSAVFGVYYFAGGFVGALALLILLSHLGQRAGVVSGLGAPHFHVLGKLLFAFTVFWAYIGFAQGFLIWIANKPEEVIWYVPRVSGTWKVVGVLLIVGHFVLPFLALLNRELKRRPAALASVAAWLLAMHYVDVHWQILPSLHAGGLRAHWLDLAALLAIGGPAVACSLFRLRGHALVATRDPSYAASLGYTGT